MGDEKKLSIRQIMKEQIEYLHHASRMIDGALGSMGYSDAANNAKALAEMSGAMADLIEIARIIKAENDRK